MSSVLRRLRQPSVIVGIAIGVFVLYFSAAAWFRQVNLVTAQFDMGNMDQTLWHTLRGRFFQMTDPGSPTLVSRATFHADYLLLIYWPFYALVPDPRTVMILQVLFVASGAMPLFWLARQRLGQGRAAVLSILYLFFPTMQWAMIFDVHAVVLAAPLLLWSWWAMRRKRWEIYFPLILLAVLAKEQVGVTVGAMGLYWLGRSGYRRAGLATMVIGFGTTILMLGAVIPDLRNAPGHFALGNYSNYGATFDGVLRGIGQHPMTMLSAFVQRDAIQLFLALLVPVSGLALLGWPVLLLAVPELAINLLSSNANQHTMFFQYQAVIVPIIFLAAIEGWARLDDWLRRRHRDRMMRLVPRVVAIVGLAMAWLLSPLPGSYHHTDGMLVWRASPYRQDIRAIQQSLRATDRVVATNNLVPQFSRRDLIWGFPNSVEQADAVIVLEGGDYEFLPPAEISSRVAALQADRRFTLIIHDRQLWYYRRVSGG